jgi:hypothetical protein
MSVSSIGGVGAATSLKADGANAHDRAAGDAAAQPRAPRLASTVQIDEATQEPVPPRFPWLSRLAAQLEAAAKQRATFPSAPVLGDNLDKTA